MKCPMRPYKDNVSPPKTQFSDCIGSECAWFFDDNNSCAMIAITMIEETINRTYHENKQMKTLSL